MTPYRTAAHPPPHSTAPASRINISRRADEAAGLDGLRDGGAGRGVHQVVAARLEAETGRADRDRGVVGGARRDIPQRQGGAGAGTRWSRTPTSTESAALAR